MYIRPKVTGGRRKTKQILLKILLHVSVYTCNFVNNVQVNSRTESFNDRLNISARNLLENIHT